MKIIIHAKPNSKKNSVEKIHHESLFDNEKNDACDEYKVYVTERAVDGKANKAIIKAIATYFNVAPSCVVIIAGQTHKQKVVEIIE